MLRALAHLAVVSLVAASCGDAAPTEPDPLQFPPHFAPPSIPRDNAITPAKVALGRRLFFDRRLSSNGTQSCGSCHRPSLAFTDGRAQPLGSTGETHRRSAPSLANVGYYAALTWANPLQHTLERQSLVPMFSTAPVELGLAGMDRELIARLRSDANYPAMFRAAFPERADPIDVDAITRALASFERTLISGDSAVDRYDRGDRSALSESALRGRELFYGRRLNCSRCHGGFAFTDAAEWVWEPRPQEVRFHNTGLYNVDGRGAYPAADTGAIEVTRRTADMGAFRTPTLRNIALTAPYMHDGSIATLDGVLDHYAAGGRTISSGPNAGDGHASPLRDPLVTGFTLSSGERADVLAFLRSLTDSAFVSDPRFRDPFGRE